MLVSEGFLLSNLVSASVGQRPRFLKACGVTTLIFKDLGQSAEFTPNHGYYSPSENIVCLNDRMIEDQAQYSANGVTVPVWEFILYHELAHAFDERLGLPSENDSAWHAISGWSPTPYSGAERIEISDPMGGKFGEWYYRSGSKFCRYYGRTNPWDDFADTLSFYILGMYDFIPEQKLAYIKAILGENHDR